MSINTEVLVEVDGVSKKFSKNLKRSLWYGLRDVFKVILGKSSSNYGYLRKEEFWAVKNISFTLRRGECLGLIGHNGAGKSTLLKMLNGLISPDEGSIVMRGKVGALIELGAGFNPLLTGRENIYTNGQLLGLSKREIDAKLETIIAFAEIGDFIDSPVQNYSSGMKVRLGFAVAAQMEPDVLIIDEVLAVGDLGFIFKCFNVIDSILPNTAVIFVSHNMPQVSRICSKILLMDRGKEKYIGDNVADGINLYYKEFSRKNTQNEFQRNEDAQLLELSFGAANVGAYSLYAINHGEDLQINLNLKINSKYDRPSISVILFDKEQRPIGICADYKGLQSENIVKAEGEFNIYQCTVVIPKINLSQGLYSVSVMVSETFNYKPMLKINSVGEFQVFSKYQFWHPIQFEGIWR